MTHPENSTTYPPEAYAPNGVLWWRLDFWPGMKREFGAERKIAAYLAFVLGEGAVFTMRDLRAALGAGALPADDEQLNRRLRRLRPDGWVIPSARNDAGLAINEYRVREIGWYPGCGDPRPKNNAVSNATRRRVFDRDGHVCQSCFAPGGDDYVDMPDETVRLTVGHRVPGKRADAQASIDELQTECALCNETVRDELFDPLTLPQLMPGVTSLKRQDKEQLLRWLEAGTRTPSKVERLYAQSRRLRPSERAQLIAELQVAVGEQS